MKIINFFAFIGAINCRLYVSDEKKLNWIFSSYKDDFKMQAKRSLEPANERFVKRMFPLERILNKGISTFFRQKMTSCV